MFRKEQWDLGYTTPSTEMTTAFKEMHTIRSGQISLEDVDAQSLAKLRRLNSVLFPVQYSASFYKNLLLPDQLAQLAVFNGTCIGTVACRKQPLLFADTPSSFLNHNAPPPAKLEVYLMTLGVLAPYRRLGVGRVLLDSVVRFAVQDPSVVRIVLHVQVDNDDALRFYHRNGFRTVRIVENYYRRIDPPNAYLLEYRLRCQVAILNLMAESEATFGLSAGDAYPEEYLLLELTPGIASQLESAQQTGTLVVRGRGSDIATLIDLDDRAYELHTAHTSNNLYLLTRESENTLLLRAKQSQVFELQQTYPQIRARLAEVLGWDKRGPFRGAEFEQASVDRAQAEEGSGDEHTRVTDAILARHVQAGSRLLMRVLAEIPAFCDRASGSWRILDAGYCMDLLRLILATQVEQDWSLDALDSQLVFQALQSESGGELLLPEAVEAILARFGRLVGDSESHTYAIDSTRVARYLAEQIFAAEDMRPWPVTEFLKALRATMPPQLQSAIEQDSSWGSRHIQGSLVREMAYASAGVDGQLLYSASGVSHHSTYLNPLFRSSLPHEPRLRMQKLFAVKPRWSRSEIQPFLEDLVDVDPDLLMGGDERACAAVKKAIDTWLIKFGRGVKGPAGEMIYSSRLN
ncbi:N-acetyltransferase 5 [Dipsacomyces acuminosporus]|nr:N-acetyltransferase 5 [Dipsacomyces acuminosporus]